MEPKLSREVAQKEIESWLDYKKVSESKKELQADNIDSLIDAMVCGDLVLEAETKVFKQTLKFPTEGEMPIKTLEFKPRLKMSTVHSHLQSVKATDADGRILAYIAALTSKPKDIIKSLDSEDYAICQSIAVFFV